MSPVIGDAVLLVPSPVSCEAKASWLVKPISYKLLERIRCMHCASPITSATRTADLSLLLHQLSMYGAHLHRHLLPISTYAATGRLAAHTSVLAGVLVHAARGPMAAHLRLHRCPRFSPAWRGSSGDRYSRPHFPARPSPLQAGCYVRVTAGRPRTIIPSPRHRLLLHCTIPAGLLVRHRRVL